MENFIWIAIGLVFIFNIFLAYWLLKIVREGKRNVIITKEEFSIIIKRLETELAKLRKELTKHEVKNN